MTFAEKYIDLPRARLAYYETGRADGETLVLAHSLFLNKDMFKPLMGALADDFRLVAYDSRGHGASSTATDDRYDMEAYYDEAAQFVERLDVGPVHFAGNSMGGWVALRMAARRPDLIRSAIAMGSTGDDEDDVHAFDPVLEQLRARGGEGFEDGFSFIFFGDASLTSESFAPLRNYWLNHLTSLSTFYALPGAAVAHRSAVNPELRHCNVPVLAIAGAQDHVFPPSLSENIARAARHGKAVVIPEAGHSVSIEAPEQVAAAIRAFVSDYCA
ncbi:alpha/beta fold hydrolase [Sphingobium subterraneum]|uniref:3-oxoadipate enol-lactonase n=1 Tax=Sphingobium subterraneum TaxID=627688 RepID=A0A841J9W8_9SPHN|nr:alpha/beta hydrolase [Sphingobium subterraneum]MBB6125295.1 3-oxoadipate enol-lactonase [Sphingobium subterraneum]